MSNELEISRETSLKNMVDVECIKHGQNKTRKECWK